MKKIFIIIIIIIISIISFSDNLNITNIDKINKLQKNDNLYFIIMGDSRNREVVKEGMGIGDSIFSKIVDNINNDKVLPDFVIHTGDLTLIGLNVEYQRYLKKINTSVFPWISLKGNHEVYSDSGDYYYNKYFGTTDISFDVGNYTFICFGTGHHKKVGDKNYCDYFISQETLMWMDSVLLETKKNGTIPIVLTHVPPILKPHITSHCLGGEKEYPKPNIEKSNVKTFLNMMKFYGIHVGFFAHIHQYINFNVDNINYIVSGGAGAPLHENGGYAMYHYIGMKSFGNDSLCGTLFDENGNEIDKKFNFTIDLSTEIIAPSLDYSYKIENDSLILRFDNALVRHIILKDSSEKEYLNQTIINNNFSISLENKKLKYLEIITGDIINKEIIEK